MAWYLNVLYVGPFTPHQSCSTSKVFLQKNGFILKRNSTRFFDCSCCAKYSFYFMKVFQNSRKMDLKEKYFNLDLKV